MVSRSGYVVSIAVGRLIVGRKWRGVREPPVSEGEGTYRTHDGRLPVELRHRQYAGLRGRVVLSAASWARPPQPRGSCTKSDVPNHLQWGQLSRRKEGHCSEHVSNRAQRAGIARLRRGSVV